MLRMYRRYLDQRHIAQTKWAIGPMTPYDYHEDYVQHLKVATACLTIHEIQLGAE